MMALTLNHNNPDMVYCGTLLRDKKEDVKILYRPFELKLLKRGQQPTSLQSLWFKASLFSRIGKFSTEYRLRGAFDFLCRFCAQSKKLTFASTSKVLTDYDLRWVSKPMIVIHFLETGKIIFKYYGVFTLIHWIFIEKEYKKISDRLDQQYKTVINGKVIK